jgi:hypothetical protein
MEPRDFDELAEKVLRETSSSRRCLDGDRVHVSNRLGLRDEAEQIGDDPGSVTDDERCVAKLVDQERMVQVTRLAPVPELRQLFENLIVVLLRTGRYRRRLGHGRSAGLRSCASAAP